MNATSPVQLIAVVGGSGAGKGWFVARLCELLGEHATHLQLDHFYRDRSHLPMAHRARLNFDTPNAIDWAQAERVFTACRAGEAAEVPRYDFATYSRLSPAAPWQAKPLVFVEGLWLLRPPAVRKLFHLKIYLDTPADLRRERRFKRDAVERGYTIEVIEERYRTVAPMHERYVEPQKKSADVVLAQPYDRAQVENFSDRLWTILGASRTSHQWEQADFRRQLTSLLVQHEYCN
jgi:uridine kinase